MQWQVVGKGGWPDVAMMTLPDLTTASDANSHPDGIAIAQWKAIQQQCKCEQEVSAALATCELDRWLESLYKDRSGSTQSSGLLDVECLFGGCCNE
jgi:hypothetical protein